MGINHTIWEVIGEIGQTALISLAIFFFVYVFLVQPHRVKGESMVPNFADGELLLTEKVSYYFHGPQRGDVIVFRAPGLRNVDFIKRVIGLPGETVEVKEGSVFINGNQLRENYIKSQTEGNLNLVIGKDEYLVLGDNRGASSDSRSFGPIKKDSIRGRAWLVYWPIFKTASSAGARFILSEKTPPFRTEMKRRV